MKAVLYYGAKDVRYTEDADEPQLVNPNDVKIKVSYCGICGSDLHEYLDGPIFFPKNGDKDKISGHTLPLIEGHEFSGVVTEIGEGVKNFKVGDHVVAEATGHCSDRANFKGHVAQDIPFCAACKRGMPNICKDLSFLGLGQVPGAFAQYIVYGEEHVLQVPDSIPLDLAALVEPLSVAWHAVGRANIKPGQSALVCGGGPIGLAAILALKGKGIKKIVVSEPAALRREFAKKLGAEVFNPVESKNPSADLRALVPETDGFDVALDASGIQATFENSISALAARGIAVNIAFWPDKPIKYNPMALSLEEKYATGSLGYVVKDFEEVLEAMDDGRIPLEDVRMLITGKVDVSHTVDVGYKNLIEHKAENVKILISPNDEPVD